MRLSNYIKETSERSDATNWAKAQLIAETDYYFDGIEGCNQNADNQTTHLFERAHVDIDLSGPKSKQEVIDNIVRLETKDALRRKINFASAFGLPLSYVLHNDELGYVFVLEFKSIVDAEIVESFSSYEGFGNFLAKIKGWKSNKKFREYQDLPKIDRVLRANGTPWPTNIDCFCADAEGRPIALIEYQNASSTGVVQHSNNDFFLCKQKSTRRLPSGETKTIYHDDIRRWTSQEICRVQSGLPLLVITWSQQEHHFQLKEVKHIAFPDFEVGEDRWWIKMKAYKEDLHRFAQDPSQADYQVICGRKSMSLKLDGSEVVEERYMPPLSKSKKTFPHIYWKRKVIVSDDRSLLSPILTKWL